MTKDESIIPIGMYCYTPVKAPCKENGFVYEVKRCPYWELKTDYPEQQNGYCHYLETGDMENTFLLWNSVKECGVNYDEQTN